MSVIKVNRQKDFPEAVFKVSVEGALMTEHEVRLAQSYYEHLAGRPDTYGRVSPEELIAKSFEFLLKREPNTAILPSFNLSVIADYFGEYESEIARAIRQ